MTLLSIAPTPATASPVPDPGRATAPSLRRGMKRYHGGVQQGSMPVCASPQLSYFGGPVLQSPSIVAVFWNGAVNAMVQAKIGQFYSDITQSAYWAWLHEYDTLGRPRSSKQSISPGSYGGSFVIAPLKCASGGSICRISDADVQAELARQIDLGVLPAPTLDCTGNANTIYMVDFPPNISV